MSTVQDIVEECKVHAHDTGSGELTNPQWVILAKSASYDARNNGWYVPLEDDETLTITATDFVYTVPARFAYIEKLMLEDTINDVSVYNTTIPSHHWELRLNGSTPQISFNTIEMLAVDKHIKVVGQARPSIYGSLNQTVDPGMESFLRERLLYFAFRFMGAGLSELARWRQSMATQAWQTSEMFLQRHPQEFRQNPDSIYVPGR